MVNIQFFLNKLFEVAKLNVLIAHHIWVRCRAGAVVLEERFKHVVPVFLNEFHLITTQIR